MEDLLNTRGIGFDYKRPTLVKHKSQSQIIHPDYTLHISSLIIDYFPGGKDADEPARNGQNYDIDPAFQSQRCRRTGWRGGRITILSWIVAC